MAHMQLPTAVAAGSDRGKRRALQELDGLPPEFAVLPAASIAGALDDFQLN